MDINRDAEETIKHNVLVNSSMAGSGVVAILEEFKHLGFDECINLACLVSVSINEHMGEKWNLGPCGSVTVTKLNSTPTTTQRRDGR